MSAPLVGASGIPLTVDAETERMASVTIRRGKKAECASCAGGKTPPDEGDCAGCDGAGKVTPEVVLPVRYVMLPYVVARELIFESQREFEADHNPHKKSAQGRYQDAHLLRCIKSVDGKAFTTEFLLGLPPDLARALVDLIDNAGVDDEGKSGA